MPGHHSIKPTLNGNGRIALHHFVVVVSRNNGRVNVYSDESDSGNN